MKVEFYSEKMPDKSWMFATVLDISEIVDAVTNEQLSEFLKEFGRSGCSYEMIFETDSDGKEVCSLLVRENSFNLGELRNTFESFVNLLIDRLTYENYKISLKKPEDTKKLIERLNSRRRLYLCVPGDKSKDFRLCYIPGGYIRVEPVDFMYLMSIIKSSQNAGLSIQFTTTRILEIENHRIEEILDWIQKTFTNSDEIGYAINMYQLYKSMAMKNIFFTCLSFWGDDETSDQIAYVFRGKGYGIQRVPDELIYKRDYLLDGGQMLPGYATAAAHYRSNFNIVIPQGFNRLDYLMTADMLDCIFSADSQESEDGQRKVNDIKIPEEFLDGEGIKIGTEDRKNQSIYIPLPQITKHMTIAGMSGAGKTTLLFNILIECQKKKIPFLIIEPTKTEYRELVDVIPDMNIYTPGNTKISPIMFNPFLPPEGVTLEQFLPSLLSSFQVAFSMTTPLDVIFSESVRNCYAKYGWRNDSTRDCAGVRHFGLHEFICEFKEEIKRSSYDYESKQNLNSGGVYRLQNLINNNPYLFDTDKTVDLDKMLTGCTLIELDAIDNQEQKTLFMSMLLLQIKLYIRQKQVKDSRLKNLILVDEAHVLLGAQTHSRTGIGEVSSVDTLEDYLLDMVKVNRVYGTGMIFADQSLAILESFVNNSNIKVVMHLESYEERMFLKNNLNLSENVYNGISKLKVGQFYISCERLPKPILVQMDDIRQNYKISSDISDEFVREKMQDAYILPFAECACTQGCDIHIRNEADFVARNVCSRCENCIDTNVAGTGNADKKIDNLISEMIKGNKDEEQLFQCAKLMTKRMMQRRVPLDDQQD